ncbi:conserved hypothetical protein [Burkholderia pseudomallei 1710a]|uniref:Uncharacterized protein n=1 Tax=Burkholderia pseudomallei 1710a TaxID=320371 RepID=A0A0E1VT95_BURPE|nr:conserved hypothetical protein [Burkholderia pseudomallei 1710a]
MSARCAAARRARRRIARIADRVSPIGYRASGRGRMRAALPPRVAPYVAVCRRMLAYVGVCCRASPLCIAAYRPGGHASCLSRLS